MEKKRIQEKNKKEEIRKRALKRKSEGNNDLPSKEKYKKECHHKEAHRKMTHHKVIHQKESHSRRDTSNNTNKVNTNSPGSDSLQSTPSPSQFLAANKIISSMKAQLPEEYYIKEKQKDTFADIEQGICNQTPEYPFNKHPATPPQFSEANKLVSAIKSKLTYKVMVPQEESVMTFANAKDRMETLRRSLTETTNTAQSVQIQQSKMETTEKCHMSGAIEKSPEAMEVEDVKEIEPPRPQAENEMCNIPESLILKGEKPTLFIPWRVINELDKMKDTNNGSGAVCKKARAAMDFLYKSLPENDRIKGQSLRDANCHIYPCEMNDDEVLNCCLQQIERGKNVLLLSEDKNLCNKATLNNVPRIGVEGLRYMMEDRPDPDTDPQLSTRMKQYEDAMYQLLANILESEMRARYGLLWQHVVHRAPPWQLGDVLASLLKHWRTVFCEVFPRIERLLADLAALHSATISAGKRAISESDVDAFKELCLDIAKKCQIIPDYMELAKTAVNSLSEASSPAPANSHVLRDPVPTNAPSPANAPAPANAPSVAPLTANTTAPLSKLVEAFENVWTLFSSYCAKLCACLGVPHGLPDGLAGHQTADSLSHRWAAFRGHANALALAIKGVLSVENSDAVMEEQVSRLESALKESLSLMSVDGGIVRRDDLRIFCMKNRDMLQEAFAKLSQLTDLLDVCKNTMHN
ncbi:unnamed protein product, partial [Iphiclides podalirius]